MHEAIVRGNCSHRNTLIIKESFDSPFLESIELTEPTAIGVIATQGRCFSAANEDSEIHSWHGMQVNLHFTSLTVITFTLITSPSGPYCTSSSAFVAQGSYLTILVS
jgi:hypothetical protein